MIKIVYKTTEYLTEVRHNVTKELNTVFTPLIKLDEKFDVNKLYQYFIKEHHYPIGKKRFSVMVKQCVEHHTAFLTTEHIDKNIIQIVGI